MYFFVNHFTFYLFRKEIVGLCKLFKKLVATYGAESTSSVAAMSSAVLITIPTQVLKAYRNLNVFIYLFCSHMFESYF